MSNVAIFLLQNLQRINCTASLYSKIHTCVSSEASYIFCSGRIAGIFSSLIQYKMFIGLGDDWEHEEIFTDDDEAVGNDPEEREDLAPEVPAPPEIKQV